MSTSEHVPASPLTRKPTRSPGARGVDIVQEAGDRNVRQGKYTCLGYRSAGQVGRDGNYPLPGSEDWHTASDRVQLVNQSLQFYRDNGLYRGLIDRAVVNAVGSGFGHQARTGSKAWNRECERLWLEWEQAPEVRGLFSWADCQAMALSESLKTGDHAAILLSRPEELDGRIQLVESDRITGGPKGIQGNGIKANAYGRPLVFYVADYGTMGQVDQATVQPIPAEDVAWIALLDRPSQTRGMPAAQSAFPMIHRISDVCDSEALAWQILSRIALRMYREGADTWAQDTSIVDPDKVNEDVTATGEVALRVHEFDSALIFHALHPGDVIEGVERNIPGQNFPDAIRMFLRLMGLPLGLPLELILLDFSQTNYSSIRGSLEQAFAQFRRFQRLLSRYSITIRNRWVDRQVARGALTDRPDRYLHEWVKPDFPWLDELQEAQAWGVKVDRGFATHGQACKSLNHDRDALMDAREAEVRDAIERAQRIKADTGEAVPWQHFAGLKPEGAKPAAPNSTPPSQDPGHAPTPQEPQGDARTPGEKKEPE